MAAPRTTATCSSTDYVREFRFEYPGSNLDDYKIFDPKTHEKDADSQLWGPIEDMVQAINETPEAIFDREVSNYLDLGKVASHLALENFVAEDDGILGYAGMNNFYLYRFEDSRRSQFLAWDKDNTFHAVDFDIMSRVGDNVLARRTLAIPGYRTTYLNTLLDAAASAMEPDPEAATTDEDGNEMSRPGWLEREVRRQYDQIRSLTRTDTFKPFSNDEFEASIEGLLTFARERAAFVKDRVARAAALRRTGVRRGYSTGFCLLPSPLTRGVFIALRRPAGPTPPLQHTSRRFRAILCRIGGAHRWLFQTPHHDDPWSPRSSPLWRLPSAACSEPLPTRRRRTRRR